MGSKFLYINSPFLKGKVGYQGFSDRFPFWTKQISSLPLFTQVLEVIIRTPLNIQFKLFFPCKSFSSVCNMATDGKRQKCKKKNSSKALMLMDFGADSEGHIILSIRSVPKLSTALFTFQLYPLQFTPNASLQISVINITSGDKPQPRWATQ